MFGMLLQIYDHKIADDCSQEIVNDTLEVSICSLSAYSKYPTNTLFSSSHNRVRCYENMRSLGCNNWSINIVFS